MTNIVKKFLPVLFALVLVLSFSLATAMPATAQGNTWYVNATTGNDSYTGTAPNDAFQTIEHAITTANDTDTIMVAAGTYYERVEVNKQLTLTGDLSQPSNVVVDAGGSGNAITLEVDGCVLQGFKAQNGRDGIYLDGSSANTLTNNIATLNTRHGIYLDGSNNNTLTGNTVTGNYDCGIKLDGSSGNTINFNNIYGNTNYGVNNASATSVNAKNNWWGANDGPGTSPGSGDKVSTNVDYEPWIVLGVSANPTSIVANGSSTSTITSDMTINSNGENTSASGHIPDGTQIIFTTDKGSIGSVETTIEGKATAILTSSTTAETATVTAKAPPHTDVAEGSTTVDFTPGSLDNIVISLDTASITAGDTQSYTAEAFDQHDNSLGNITNDTTFEIAAGAGGSWAANSYTSENAGTWTVTGSYSGKSDTAILTVTAGLFDHIVISPDTATIAAGDSQTYTAEAFDQYDNSLGNITNNTTFEIVAGAGGSWAANVYTSENAGTWTVAGTYSSKSDTATLTVTEGSLPPTVSIDSPQDGYLTTDSTATIEGTVVATPLLDEATLTVNGVSKTITVSDGVFSEQVSLVTGDNTLTVSVSNVMGTDSDSITVTRGSKPVVDITSPLDGTIFQATTITIEGTIDAIPEVTEATLTLNGNASTITVTNGEFSETVDLAVGENAIVVSATNVAGAGTSPLIAVTLNEEAPPTPPPPPSSTTNWWLIGGISGGVTLIALVVFRMFLRRY